MTDVPLEALLANHRIHIPEQPPVLNVAAQDEAVSPPVPAPTQEHVAAVDGAFLRQRHEQETIASLIGLRLSVLLMHDLAKDAIPAAEEEERAEEMPPDGEPE